MKDLGKLSNTIFLHIALHCFDTPLHLLQKKKNQESNNNNIGHETMKRDIIKTNNLIE